MNQPETGSYSPDLSGLAPTNARSSRMRFVVARSIGPLGSSRPTESGHYESVSTEFLLGLRGQDNQGRVCLLTHLLVLVIFQRP
jgi:hypothetical protein